jgi:hypothetical protein
MAKRHKWSHLKKYWFKKGKKRRSRRRKTTHKRKARHMARKRKGGRRRSYRRRHHTHRRRRRGGSHGAGGRGVAALKHDLPLMAVAAAYGFAEAKSKADSNFFLNKLPKPVTQLGFAGNTALALYVGTMLTPNKWLRLSARAVAMVAAYQLGKNGGAFNSGTQILGELDDGDERVIDAHVMGALEAEGDGSGRQVGLQYDTVVREAGGRV